MEYATMEADKKGGFPCAAHWNRTSILVHIFKKKIAYANTKKNVRTNLFPSKKSHMYGKSDGMKNITKNDSNPSVMEGFIFSLFSFPY